MLDVVLKSKELKISSFVPLMLILSLIATLLPLVSETLRQLAGSATEALAHVTDNYSERLLLLPGLGEVSHRCK